MQDIQTRKLLFVEEFLRLTDEKIIDKLSELLHQEKAKRLKSKPKRFSHPELAQKLDRSQQDIEAGRIHSQQDVENYFKNRYQ